MRVLEFLNGEYLEPGNAEISALDRGFIFGDGVYEVARIYNGKFFTLEPHLRRMERGLKEIRIDLPSGIEGLMKKCEEVREKSQVKEGSLYIQVSRGAAERTHVFPAVDTPPTVYMYVSDVDNEALSEKWETGVSAITAEDIRWHRCDIKSVNLLPNILSAQKAKDVGCWEAIQIRPDGMVTEGTRTNLFIVKNGILMTPPLSNWILPGITRSVVIEVCERKRIPFVEAHLTEQIVKNASESFMTGTVSEITPILKVDDAVIGTGTPGNITRMVQKGLKEIVAETCK